MDSKLIGTNTWNVSCVQVLQAALKGLQCCLSGGKWKYGGEEELGSILASLKVQNYDSFPIYFFLFCPMINDCLYCAFSTEAHVPRNSRCKC